MTLPPDDGALRAKLYELGAVIEESSDDAGQIVLTIEINRVDYQRLFAHEK